MPVPHWQRFRRDAQEKGITQNEKHSKRKSPTPVMWPANMGNIACSVAFLTHLGFLLRTPPVLTTLAFAFLIAGSRKT